MHRTFYTISSFPKKAGIKVLFLFCLFLLHTPGYGQIEILEDTTSEFSTATHFDPVYQDLAPSADVRTVPDTTIKKLRSDEDYWYADYVPTRKKEKNRTQSTGILGGWFSSLLWILLVGGFVAVVIWYLASSNIRLFRKPAKPVEEAGDEFHPEDIFTLDYSEEIERAAKSGNYRQAVRLMYLRALRDLSDSGNIQYTHEKTNSDYLKELKDSDYYNDFARLTLDFEYTWYGKFELSAEAFSIVRRDFDNFRGRVAA